MKRNWDVGLSISDWEKDQPGKVTMSFASQMGSMNNEQCRDAAQARLLSEDLMGQVMCLLRALFSSYENDHDNTSLTELL